MKRLGLVVAIVLGMAFSRISADAQNVSVAPGGPSGFAPGDIIAPGPAVIIPSAGAPFFPNVNGFSYGYPSAIFFTPGFVVYPEFSVGPVAVGAPGSSVASEAAGGIVGPGDHPADIYISGGPFSPAGSNIMVLDGDGVANPSLPPPLAGGIGLIEQPFLGDDVDGWDNGPPGGGGGPIWFTVDPASLGPAFPAGTGFAAPDDIYLTLAPIAGYDTSPPAVLYGAGAMLGLAGGVDDIDALVVFDDGALSLGSPFYAPGADVVLFSLAAGSPYIGTIDPGGSGLAITEGDILIDAASAGTLGPAIFMPAETIGLSTIRSGGGVDDELDALDIQFQFEPVPEPASAALFLLGLGVLMARRRLRS